MTLLAGSSAGMRTRHPVSRTGFSLFRTGSRQSFRVEGFAGPEHFPEDVEEAVGDAAQGPGVSVPPASRRASAGRRWSARIAS